MKKFFIQIIPISLATVGSLFVTFSTKIIDTSAPQDLGNGLYTTGGGVQIMGQTLMNTQQNKSLLCLGLLLTAIGFIFELAKAYKNIQVKP